MFEHRVLYERPDDESLFFVNSENLSAGFSTEAGMFSILEKEGWGLIDVPIVNGRRVYYFRRPRPKKQNFLVRWAKNVIIRVVSYWRPGLFGE